MNRVRQIASCVLVLLVLPGAIDAGAQTATGSVSGIVRDCTGAVLPKVTVTLRNVATGVSRTATTDGSGRYRILTTRLGISSSRPGRRSCLRSCPWRAQPRG